VIGRLTPVIAAGALLIASDYCTAPAQDCSMSGFYDAHTRKGPVRHHGDHRNDHHGGCAAVSAAGGLIAATGDAIASGVGTVAANVAPYAQQACSVQAVLCLDSALISGVAGSCGQSFTAGTGVPLATGKSVPISALKPGDTVLTTSTGTGRTQPETVMAVLIHHDTNLYDLKISNHGKTATIHTTSTHLFWVPGTRNVGQWVQAAQLKPGTPLRTPDVVIVGWHLRQSTMWDLAIPGDHDFHVISSHTSAGLAMATSIM
jgi:Pretoxin HINT domain